MLLSSVVDKNVETAELFHGPAHCAVTESLATDVPGH